MSEGVVVPDWLVRDEVGLCPCGCTGRRRRGDVVAGTLDAAAGLLQQAIFADDVAAQPGLLQRVEPRAKVGSILVLLVATSLVRHPLTLAVLYAATLVLAVASALPLGLFVRRVWLFIPVFTGVVVLPATCSLVTRGEIVVPLGHWFGSPVGLTRQGLTAAAIIVLRVATSISLVVLLTLTTRWNRLLAALRGLLVPRLIVQVLGMTYRYLFHLLGSVTDLYTARRARSVGPRSDLSSSRAFVAASAGALFGKAHALSEEVHQAMVARGYTGEARTLALSRVRTVDVAWLGLCVAVAVALVTGDRSLGL